MAKDVNAPRVGEEAPDFTLRSHLDSEVKLSDFRGKKNVVLAFYPLAFTQSERFKCRRMRKIFPSSAGIMPRSWA